MANPDAATLRANPAAAAELPADDAGVDEHLHATPEHPGFVRLPAGSTAAANISADGAGVDEHLHADVQHPQLLPAGRDEACPGKYARNRAARGKRRDKEDQKENFRAIFLATRIHELLQGR